MLGEYHCYWFPYETHPVAGQQGSVQHRFWEERYGAGQEHRTIEVVGRVDGDHPGHCSSFGGVHNDLGVGHRGPHVGGVDATDQVRLVEIRGVSGAEG